MKLLIVLVFVSIVSLALATDTLWVTEAQLQYLLNQLSIPEKCLNANADLLMGFILLRTLSLLVFCNEDDTLKIRAKTSNAYTEISYIDDTHTRLTYFILGGTKRTKFPYYPSLELEEMNNDINKLFGDPTGVSSYSAVAYYDLSEYGPYYLKGRLGILADLYLGTCGNSNKETPLEIFYFNFDKLTLKATFENGQFNLKDAPRQTIGLGSHPIISYDTTDDASFANDDIVSEQCNLKYDTEKSVFLCSKPLEGSWGIVKRYHVQNDFSGKSMNGKFLLRTFDEPVRKLAEEILAKQDSQKRFFSKTLDVSGALRIGRNRLIHMSTTQKKSPKGERRFKRMLEVEIMMYETEEEPTTLTRLYYDGVDYHDEYTILKDPIYIKSHPYLGKVDFEDQFVDLDDSKKFLEKFSDVWASEPRCHSYECHAYTFFSKETRMARYSCKRVWYFRNIQVIVRKRNGDLKFQDASVVYYVQIKLFADTVGVEDERIVAINYRGVLSGYEKYLKEVLESKRA